MRYRNPSSSDSSFITDLFTERQLDHLFMALALHTKSTRKEQIEWVAERRALWKSLVRISNVDPESEQVKLRTKFLESPEELRKDPTILARVFAA
jgi:hypothetical protein